MQGLSVWARKAGVTERGLPFNPRLVVPLICFALIVLNVVHDWQSRSASLRSVQAMNRSLAHSLVRQAEDTISSADSVLVGLAAQVERGGHTLDLSDQLGREMAAQVAQSDSLVDLSIYDAEGNLVLSSSPFAPGINLFDQSFFQHHLSNTDLHAFLGPPVTSQSRTSWKVTVSRRLESEEHRFVGVVAASLSSAYFEQQYRALGLGANSAVTAFRTDGTLLFRYPGDISYLGRSYAKEAMFRLWSPTRPAAFHQYFARADGIERVAAFDTSRKYPVIVNVAASMQDALADWRRETLWDMVEYGVLGSLVVWLGRRVERQARRQREADRARAENELHFRLLTEMSGDMVTRVDADGMRTYVSPASDRLLGFGADELLNTRALQASNAADVPGVESFLTALREGAGSDMTLAYRAAHRDGREIWVEANIRVTHDPETGRTNGAVMISRDITARKALEAGLQSLAATDALTGLANRRRLDEVLHNEWRRAAREGTPLSLALMDVDLFKAYNDRYGHLAGDECLRQLAQTLSRVFRRPGDLLARYGGEELAAVLPATESGGAWDVAEAARDAVEQAGLVHEGNPVRGTVTVSVGVSTSYPVPEQDAAAGVEKLLRTADMALYEAKHAGRNRVESNQSLSPSVLHRQRAERDGPPWVPMSRQWDEHGATTADDG